MTLSEYGKINNLTDDELIKIAREQLNMDENDARLMLAIERGEVAGDVIDGTDEG